LASAAANSEAMSALSPLCDAVPMLVPGVCSWTSATNWSDLLDVQFARSAMHAANSSPSSHPSDQFSWSHTAMPTLGQFWHCHFGSVRPGLPELKSVQRERNPGCWIECSTAAHLA